VRPEGLHKFKKSPHQVSNPQPSGLQHSALTTTLPPAPFSLCVGRNNSHSSLYPYVSWLEAVKAVVASVLM
jgi:hypothetical protein